MPTLQLLLSLVLVMVVLNLMLRNQYRYSPTAQRTLLTLGFALLLLLPIGLGGSPFALPVGLRPESLALVTPWFALLHTPIPGALMLLWIAVAVPRLLLLLYRIRRTRRALLELSPIESDALATALFRVVRQLNYRDARPVIRAGARTACSTLAGPTIVIPRALVDVAGACTAEAEPLAAALAHELVHLKRRDDQWLLFADLVGAVLWWLPGIRRLRRKLAAAIEASADARACDLFVPRIRYLDGLLGAARIEQTAAPVTIAEPPAGAGTEPEVQAALRADTRAGIFQRLLRATRDDLLQRLAQFRRRLDTDPAAPQTLLRLGILLAGLQLLAALTPIERAAPAQRALHPAMVLPAAALPSAPRSAVPRVTSDIEVLGRTELAARSGPRLISQPAVVYPGVALLSRQRGSVVVEFTLARDGTPLRPHVVDSSAPAVFDAAALRAVALSRYESWPRPRSEAVVLAAFPADPQPLRVRQRFRFELIAR
ncbi:MAG: TonB family protein [Pseudomonadota bacterium]